ncbi:MAG: hypothetical protein WA971_09845, partial [Microbacterium sp.]
TPGDPLERLFAAHDTINRAWMQYETDPARVLAFPQMTDGSAPATMAFFAAQSHAAHTRPNPEAKRITPGEFSAYREAVTALERAFAEAESASGAAGRGPRPTWQDAAQTALERGAEAIALSADAIRNATDAFRRRP